MDPKQPKRVRRTSKSAKKSVKTYSVAPALVLLASVPFVSAMILIVVAVLAVIASVIILVKTRKPHDPQDKLTSEQASQLSEPVFAEELPEEEAPAEEATQEEPAPACGAADPKAEEAPAEEPAPACGAADPEAQEAPAEEAAPACGAADPEAEEAPAEEAAPACGAADPKAEEEAPAEEAAPACGAADPEVQEAPAEEPAPACGAADPVAEEAPVEPMVVTETGDEVELVHEEKNGEEIVHAYNPVTQTYVRIQYNRSFTARLIQSDDTVKDYYTVLKNKLLTYHARARRSWKHESFRVNGKEYVRMAMRGKTLCLYFALPVSEYADTKYKVEDVSSINKYKEIPCLYRIKNNRRCQYAMDLIDAVFARAGIESAPRKAETYDMPYETTEALLEQKLIKKVVYQETEKEAHDAIVHQHAREAAVAESPESEDDDTDLTEEALDDDEPAEEVEEATEEVVEEAAPACGAADPEPEEAPQEEPAPACGAADPEPEEAPAEEPAPACGAADPEPEEAPAEEPAPACGAADPEPEEAPAEEPAPACGTADPAPEENVIEDVPLPEHEVSVAEAREQMDDVQAKHCINIVEKKVDKRRPVVVNIDTLNLYFENGEHVNLNSMKTHIPDFSKKATYVKVLARGKLGKTLFVEADDFSADAIKMIVLEGGKVYRTQDKTKK